MLKFVRATGLVFLLGKSLLMAEWHEIRSTNFTVFTSGDRGDAKRVCREFEQIRELVGYLAPGYRNSAVKPLWILLVGNREMERLLPPGTEIKPNYRYYGVFQPRLERDYALLQLGGKVKNRYETVYYGYLKILNGLNHDYLPAWLDDGLAALFAASEIGDSRSEVGQPAVRRMQLLQSGLIPLEEFFADQVGQSDQFQSQAWAIVHYLYFDEEAREKKYLDQLMQLLATNVPEKLIISKVFGDLSTLEKKLNRYVRQSVLGYVQIPTSPNIDPDRFSVRQLPDWEASVTQAVFMASFGHLREAEALLGEVTASDHSVFHETLGLIHRRLKEDGKALRDFSEAIELEPGRLVSNLMKGMLLAETGDDPQEAIGHLQNALQQERRLGPALYGLASIFRIQGRLEEASEMAARAVQAEPSNPSYRLLLAEILLRLDRVAEALKIGQRLIARSRTEWAREEASQLVRKVAERKTELEARPPEG